MRTWRSSKIKNLFIPLLAIRIGDRMDSLSSDIKPDIVAMINDRQEVTYSELRSFASSLNTTEDVLKKSLKELEDANTIA